MEIIKFLNSEPQGSCHREWAIFNLPRTLISNFVELFLLKSNRNPLPHCQNSLQSSLLSSHACCFLKIIVHESQHNSSSARSPWTPWHKSETAIATASWVISTVLLPDSLLCDKLVISEQTCYKAALKRFDSYGGRMIEFIWTWVSHQKEEVLGE